MENLKIDVRLTKITTEDKFRGYASITVADAITVNGIRIFQRDDGSFYLIYPSRKGKSKDTKEDTFFGLAYPTKEAIKVINDKIINSYIASV